jgi:hypothetical protein
MKFGFKLKYSGLLLAGLIITGCGSDALSPGSVTPLNSEESKKITQILDNINIINTKLDKLEKMTGNNVTRADTSTPDKTTVKKPETTDPVKTPESPAPKTNTTDPAKGRKILDKVINTFVTAGGVDMTYDKYEKNPDTGKIRDTGTHLIARNPDTVLIEIIRNPDDKGKEGTKIKYNVNDATVKVRSTGIASLATVTLDLTDERIVSPNGHKLNQGDVLALMKRLKSASYNAELTGKTSINGTEIYVLKVTNTGTNSLDAKIDYENIGFNPKDFTLRMWEAYSKKDTKAFINLNVSKINLLNSVTDSQLKL